MILVYAAWTDYWACSIAARNLTWVRARATERSVHCVPRCRPGSSPGGQLRTRPGRPSLLLGFMHSQYGSRVEPKCTRRPSHEEEDLFSRHPLSGTVARPDLHGVRMMNAIVAMGSCARPSCVCACARRTEDERRTTDDGRRRHSTPNLMI